jgi:tRNA(His) 5'-end guanylyltransferase
MMPDDFETRLREGEWFHSQTVPPGLWTVLRLDGRGFSALTESAYTKPFDERFRDHMLATASALTTDFNAILSYVQSDEISLVLPPAFDLFGRSHEKLASVSAGIASSSFTAAARQQAHFDSRVWVGAKLEDVVDYCSWRQSDATRNGLNTWCYWTLRGGGQTARGATRALKRIGTSAKNELLFSHGINFNDTPTWQRRGFTLHWEDVPHVGIDPRDSYRIQNTRRQLITNDTLPMRDEFRALVRAHLNQTPEI